MKKVGILTFHHANSFGAALQAYALSEYLRKKNLDVEIIDYRCPAIENSVANITKIIKKDLRGFVSSLLYIGSAKRMRKFFVEFENKYMTKSPRAYSSNQELCRFPPIYDKYICGSDQIWNYLITNDDDTFYLNFIQDDNKKISYAASFGLSDIAPDRLDKTTEFLKRFQFLSVREKQGQSIIKKLTNRDADIVVDPTLLLEREDWRKVAKPIPLHRPYVLVYALEPSQSMEMFAQKLAAKNGCMLVMIGGSLKDIFKKDFKLVRALGPREFVGLIMDAAYVVTNSFHATIFSINFQKQFFTELLKRSRHVNSRLTSILQLLNLEERIIQTDNWDECSKLVNYDLVSPLLKCYRKNSFEFLDRAINK